jgi:hypothetical protein
MNYTNNHNTVKPVSQKTRREGLKLVRLSMVISSLSPLFILLAVSARDNDALIGFCAAMIVVSNLFLWLRIHTSRRHHDKHPISVGKVSDNRSAVAAYLIAILMPVYSTDLRVTLVALAIVVGLFWYIDFYYVHPSLMLFGYRIFTVDPVDDGNPIASSAGRVLITKRRHPRANDDVIAYRLSNSVYLENTP